MRHNPFPIHDFGSSDTSIGRQYRTAWVEESFDAPKNTGAGEVTTGGSFLGLAVSSSRQRLVFFVMIIAIGLLLGRSFYLQVARGTYYQDLAEGNCIRILPLIAPRGVFFDRNQKQLVKNVPSYDLMVTIADLPTDTEQQVQIFQQVSEVVKIPLEEIKQRLKEQQGYRYQPILIASSLNYDQIIALRLMTDLPGVNLVEGARRQYLLANDQGITQSLAHVLGYTGQLTREEYEAHKDSGYFLSDLIGKTGLEKEYERQLKGINGGKQIEVDALGRELKIITEQVPQAGADLTIGLDLELQQIAETALREVLQEYGKKKGAVVALDPRDGSIRALVSLPSFDSNQFTQGITTVEYQKLVNDPSRPLFPRAIAGVYPSGSTIKPVMVVAALAEKVITPQTSFVSVGGLRVGQWFFPDWKVGGHDVTNMYKAIAESVNTFFYAIGGGIATNGNPANGYDFAGLGPYRISDWLQRFGLGSLTGIDLPGEEKGFVPTVEWKNATTGELWYIGDTYNLSIGQGNLQVTPLQVANWTAAVANGGTLYQPRLVTRIGDRDIAPVVIRSNLSDPTDIAEVRRAMRQTVLSGSAQSFASLPIAIAAKTGTAQWSSVKPPHAWFASFAPATDPRLVVVVLIEEGEEGSRTAAAVARRIYQQYADKL